MSSDSSYSDSDLIGKFSEEENKKEKNAIYPFFEKKNKRFYET